MFFFTILLRLFVQNVTLFKVFEVCRRIQWNQSIEKVWKRREERIQTFVEGTSKEGLGQVVQDLLQEIETLVRAQNSERSREICEEESSESTDTETSEKSNALYTISEIKIMSKSRKFGLALTQPLDLSVLENIRQKTLVGGSPPRAKKRQPQENVEKKRELRGKLAFCRRNFYISTLLQLRDMTKQLMEEKNEGRLVSKRI